MNLGPFKLVEPLATGGMATVWRAMHRDLPVAVKFMDKGKVESFADEMRVHARLDHPHILAVLDFGVLPVGLAPTLPAGTPWMALELASGGDLNAIRRDVRWIDVRTIALTLLEALATAHSHGLVHCDLKLANVLLSGPRDTRPGLKLADFGIAVGLENLVEDGSVSGTPRLMAPEQVRGAVREYGPWTDIYALGCMVHRLVSGRFSVPEGLERWLGRCLQPLPADRFMTAMDAHEALERLPAGRKKSLCHPALAMKRRQVRSTAPPAMPLLDAGLALFSVRSWPTLGRDHEERALWGALDLARQSHRPRAVVLHGEHGIGVSHLATAFGRSAEIRGLARWFTHTAHADEGPTEGLLRFVRQLVRCTGLEGEELIAGLASDRALWNSEPSLLVLLRELLTRPDSPHAMRRGAVRSLLTDRCRGKPAVIVMDDLQHSPDARSFVANILENHHEPWLFVIGVEDAASVSEITEIEGVEVLELGALEPEFVKRLIHYVLPLEGDFRAEIIVRTGGIPGRLATELERWVRSGVLEPSRFGYRPRGGMRTQLPEDEGWVDAVVDDLPEGARTALERAAIWGTVVPHALWGPLCEEGPTGVPMARLQLLERLKERDLARERGAFWEFTSAPFRRLVLDRMRVADRREGHRIAASLCLGDPIGLRLARHHRDAGDLEQAAQIYLERASDNTAAAIVSVLVHEGLEVLDLLGVPPEDPRRGHLRMTSLIYRNSSSQSFAEATRLKEDAAAHGWELPEAQARAQIALAASLIFPAEKTFALCEEAVAFARGCSPEVLPRILGPLAHTISRLGRPQQAADLLEEVLVMAREQDLENDELELLASLVYSKLQLGCPLGLAELDALAGRLNRAGKPMRRGKVLNVAGEVARASGELERARGYYLAALDAIRLCGLDGDHLRLNLGMVALERGDADDTQRWLDSGLVVTAGRMNGMYAAVVAAMELDLASLVGDVEAFRAHARRMGPLLAKGPPEQDLVVLLARAAKRIRPKDAALAEVVLGLHAAAVRACREAGIAV